MGLAIELIRFCNVTNDRYRNIAAVPPPRLRALRQALRMRPRGRLCAAEPYRLPLTSAGVSEDCLCPDCLRQAAAAENQRGAGK